MYDDGDRNSGEVAHDSGCSYRKPKGNLAEEEKRSRGQCPFRGFNVTSRTQANNFPALSYETAAPLACFSLDSATVMTNTARRIPWGITTKLWSH